MAALEGALDRAGAGAGSVLWVTGEAGVGKSRVVDELCDVAAGRGVPVLVGRAVDTGTPVPFRPLFEALSGHVRRAGADGARSVDRRALAQIVPEWRTPGEETYPASAMEIGEGLLRFLAAVADGACVLLLEDLHWSDPDTVAVVEYLADNVRTVPVLCLVTTRLEVTDHVGRVLSDLVARRSATRLELPRLTSDELASMTSMCLGAEPVDASLTSLIDDFADGLPLLVEELLTTSVADGTVATGADGWRVVAAGVPAVPERFAELVRRRLGELDDGPAHVIRCRGGAGSARRHRAALRRVEGADRGGGPGRARRGPGAAGGGGPIRAHGVHVPPRAHSRGDPRGVASVRADRDRSWSARRAGARSAGPGRLVR